MTTLTEVIEAIARYHSKYRNPLLPAPTVSGLYSLKPRDFAVSDSLMSWPHPWPSADKPGIYLILDGSERLLYIGKAAALGQRVSTYFRYATDGSKACVPYHSGWTTEPVYVVTVALMEKFEPPSLEEYLIGKFNPPDNKTWTSKSPVAI